MHFFPDLQVTLGHANGACISGRGRSNDVGAIRDEQASPTVAIEQYLGEAQGDSERQCTIFLLNNGRDRWLTSELHVPSVRSAARMVREDIVSKLMIVQCRPLTLKSDQDPAILAMKEQHQGLCKQQRGRIVCGKTRMSENNNERLGRGESV